jgi:hypothetical protein
MGKELLSTGSRWREFILVSIIVVTVSGILFWRFLPLPSGDLSFYTEPAYLLAQTGRLAAPGAQSIDLTFQKAVYPYPPGYFLILAGWLRIFGLTADSLLAYTHLAHSAALIMLWILLRNRYSCPRGVCSLVLLSFFPPMTHGRPDLTAAALSMAAWMALPEGNALARIVLSGCLAGATLMVSLALGVGIIATLAVLMLVDSRLAVRQRLRKITVWAGAAGIFFAGVTGTFLTQQHSWMIAYVQFKTSLSVRGAQLNVLPDFHLLFTWVFCVVPFFLVALLPALLAASGRYRGASNDLRNVAIAFLGGTAAWFALNKLQLLMEYHFLFPAKSVFLGVFYGWPKLPAWVRSTPLLLLFLISFYLHKADFLYLGTPLRVEARSYATEVQPQGIIAVDSLYFAKFYRPGQSLSYEVTAYESYWQRYRDAIPEFARSAMFAGLPDKPMQPDMLLISAYTARFQDLPTFNIPCERPKAFADRLHVLGRRWNLPAQPFALMVCSKPIP